MVSPITSRWSLSRAAALAPVRSWLENPRLATESEMTPMVRVRERRRLRAFRLGRYFSSCMAVSTRRAVSSEIRIWAERPLRM